MAYTCGHCSSAKAELSGLSARVDYAERKSRMAGASQQRTWGLRLFDSMHSFVHSPSIRRFHSACKVSLSWYVIRNYKAAAPAGMQPHKHLLYVMANC